MNIRKIESQLGYNFDFNIMLTKPNGDIIWEEKTEVRPYDIKKESNNIKKELEELKKQIKELKNESNN